MVRKMTSFELSEFPDFKDQYVASLFLPHTNISLFPETTQPRTVRKEAPASLDSVGVDLRPPYAIPYKANRKISVIIQRIFFMVFLQ
jgi:hypothetical protein